MMITVAHVARGTRVERSPRVGDGSKDSDQCVSESVKVQPGD
jgi:hypothetical protein